jgi:hypothetical protein
MGEARNRMMNGTYPLNGKMQQQQFVVDVSNATPNACACGCVYFQPAVKLYTISALLSPTGKELLAQAPALICKDCGKEWSLAGTEKKEGPELNDLPR